MVILLVMVTGSASASAMGETGTSATLWNTADAIADTSEQYLPGVRRISYQETDGKGSVVYADQAVVLLESMNDGRYIQVREFGDQAVFDLIGRYTDGLVLTPFTDNLYDMDYTDTGITEMINGKSAEVFTYAMAYDANLPYYDPNYETSGTIVGWDSDEEDYDGTIIGTIWIDKLTGAPMKMTNNFLFTDNTRAGTLVIEQTVYFTYENGIATPRQISTKGTLTVKAGRKGQVSITDFAMTEQQGSYWLNPKFARGETVK